MQVSVENTSKLGRKVTVQVPSDVVNQKVGDRMRDLSQKVRMKGFRPGKVPVKIIEQRYGKQVREEIVGELVNEKLREAIVENDLRPVSVPPVDIDDSKDDETIEFSASFDVFPEVENLNVEKIEIEKMVAEVTDKDVDNMIETLREQRRSWETVERAAKEEDLAFFQYSLETEDGRIPAEDAERAGVVIGTGIFDEGFEKQLVGNKAGDEFEFDITFGDDTRNKELAGKSGKASVKLEKIQESVLPEVDEEFAKAFGVEEGGMEQFRDEVRSNMARELKQVLSRAFRAATLEQLVATHSDLEIPAAMLENEMTVLHNQARENASRQGEDVEAVAEKESFREQAERRVRAALLVSEVARHAELKVDGGRVRDLVNEIASTYESPEQIVQLYYSNEELMANVQNIVLEEQAAEWVAEQAKVVEVEKNFKEVMTPAS